MATYRHSARTFRFLVYLMIGLLVVLAGLAIIFPQQKVLASDSAVFLLFALVAVGIAGTAAYNLGRMANRRRVKAEVLDHPNDEQTSAVIIDRLLPVWLIGVIFTFVVGIGGIIVLALSGVLLLLIVPALAIALLWGHVPTEQSLSRSIELVIGEPPKVEHEDKS
jgi:membrane protein YqaA with SNARE-associated domain